MQLETGELYTVIQPTDPDAIPTTPSVCYIRGLLSLFTHRKVDTIA